MSIRSDTTTPIGPRETPISSADHVSIEENSFHVFHITTRYDAEIKALNDFLRLCKIRFAKWYVHYVAHERHNRLQSVLDNRRSVLFPLLSIYENNHRITRSD